MQFFRHQRTLCKLLSVAALLLAAPTAMSLDEKAFRKELEKDTQKVEELRKEWNSFKKEKVEKEYKNSVRKELYTENRRHTDLVKRAKQLLNKYKKTKDINITNDQGQTLLMLAAAVGNDAATEMILWEKPNMTMVDINSRTALQYEKDGSGTALMDYLRNRWEESISEGDTAAVRELLEADVNPNWEIDGHTALEVAVIENNIPLASLLMDYQASPSEKTGTGCTIIELAVELNSPEILSELLRNKDALFIKFNDGTSLFHNLLSAKKAECLREWFKRAREHNITQTESGTGYLHLIIRTASEEGVTAVAADNRDILNSEDAEGNLPLFEAARRGHTDLYHTLQSLGANPNTRNKLNETVVMHACLSNNEELLEEIIDNTSIDILNEKDAAGQTAHHYAAHAKNDTATRLLNDAGVKSPRNH